MELVGQDIKFSHQYWMKDKYNRPMFKVRHSGLEKLYEECSKNNKAVSLFKTKEGQLVIVISNFTGQIIDDKIIQCREYKDSIRFYAKEEPEWIIV